MQVVLRGGAGYAAPSHAAYAGASRPVVVAGPPVVSSPVRIVRHGPITSAPAAVQGAPSPGANPRRQAFAGASVFSAAMASGPAESVSSGGSSSEDEMEAEEDQDELLTSEDVVNAAAVAGAARKERPRVSTAPATFVPAEAGAAENADMAVGRGKMAIPQAALSVDQAQVRRRLKVQDQRVDNDLRDYIRAGDVLNYLGGNRWGHVVMALGMPKAYEIPVLYTAERLPDGAIPMDSYSVTVRRASADVPWGLALAGEEDAKHGSASASQEQGHLRRGKSSDSVKENAHLVVKSLAEGCPLEAWNHSGASKRIRLDDRVVEVNGVRGSGPDLLKAAEASNVLELKLWTPSDMAVLAYNIPVYAVEVLQSASNMRDISESTVCLIVHPLRNVVCPVGPMKEGFRVSIGHSKAPVQVQVLMSPLDNWSLDFNLFRLAVQEVVRAPHDQKWSMRTAVRSYLRHAAIRPEKYQQAKDKMKLGSKLSERWAYRPICSTVPARVWQKYYLKRAYKDRATESNSPRHSVTSCSTLCLTSVPTAGDFSAEAAFADEVLRCMPVRDDRVLPEDLVNILMGTGQWDQLELEKGPPQRRCDDRSALSASPAPHPSGRGTSSALGSVAIGKTPSLAPRSKLPAGALNREGVPVHLGIDQFTVYCGTQVSRPKKATARMFAVDGEPPKPAQKFAWDGRCGPQQGPQCSACRWLEDRLVA
mmetsp:Transcript_121984/g.352384  ORF Transcript_121984/g.352384 Transcript_121984/m.352384 type:complete len:706 (-) Transcript_121984:71-2188(-)